MSLATLSPSATRSQRLFVAADLPSEVREELDTLREEFRDAGLRVVPAGQIHLTLLFLGDVEGERIERLQEALKKPAKAALPLRLRVRDVGVFSWAGRTTIGWVGVKDLMGDLKEVQENIARACRPFASLREDVPFRPHLTLARSPRNCAVDEVEVARIVGRWKRFLFADWLVPDIKLFRSEPFERGRRYDPLVTFVGEP